MTRREASRPPWLSAVTAGLTIVNAVDELFDDLLAANRRYATSAPRNFDGYAHAGIAVVTCMDSRLQPLEMLGLFLGEAKILRTPGGHVTPDALLGCALGVQLLRVDRILVISHSRCAMASGDDEALRDRISSERGIDATDFAFGADPDQDGRLRADVALLSSHPLIGGQAEVGGFHYDVDTGLLARVC
jgi:Carbonic anhydrase